jgi:hypothetical protein
MPLTVRLETETGAKLAEVFDTQDVVTQLAAEDAAPELKVAQTIDPYGNTTMNRLQVPLFLKDLRLLMSRAASPEDTAVLRQIEALANRSLEEPHLYLKFYGD